MNTMRLFAILTCAGAIAACGASPERTEGVHEHEATAEAEGMPMEEPMPMEEEEPMGEPEEMEEGEPLGQRQQPMQQPMGMEGQQQPGQMAEGQLAMRKGEESTPIREVALVRERGNRANLVFFSRDVECATVRANPSEDESFVMMVPVQLDAQGRARTGEVPAGQWQVRSEQRARPDTMRAQRGWITITSADDQRVEGDVEVSTTVQREPIEVNGPFTATVCEMETTRGAPARQGQGTQQGRQGQGTQGQQGQQY